MSADSKDSDSSPAPFSNDTLPFDMGGDARVTADGEAPGPATPTDLPTIGHIGRYVLKFKVGQGGLGTVFAAHDPLLSRLIAIKTVNPRVGNEERESFNTHFLNEARAAAGLSHPNIVTVFDAGVSPQGAYIAMELLKGRDLRQMREDGSRPTPAQAALIVRRVADALSYAHAKGVVHCDVKPANIFMVSPTQPKVLDFGIARILHPTSGAAGKQIGGGSPRYMAPEQLRGEQTDRRSDVFSLGVVLYELLTDTNPFARPSLEAITQAVVNHQPPMASLVDPAVPLALAAIVARSMEKDPAARYQSARVFARELRRWLDGQLEGSQGRDTGTDPVGLTRPGGLGAYAPQATVGTATAPVLPPSERAAMAGAGSSAASPDDRGAASGVSAGFGDGTNPGVGVATLPRTARAGGHRGWTVTGLATVALLTTLGAIWLGDVGIGARPASQQIEPAPTTASGEAAASSAPAAPATAERSTVSMAAGADLAGSTADAAARVGADTPPTAPISPPGSMATEPTSLVAGAEVPASTGAAPEQIITETNADAGSDAALPTVRLTPRIRENAVEADKPARPADKRRAAARAEANAAARDTVPFGPRALDDTPGFARRDERLAPVATAVPTRLGFVEVHASPSAEIEIDGNPGGTASPYARLRMTEGAHTITLRREGFVPRKMKVYVTEGRPVTVAHNFR